jgi:hypothetical protein
VPDLREPSRQGLDDLRPHAADQDRRMGLLQRLRLAGGVLQRVVLAAEAGALLGEQPLDHLDGFAEPPRATAGRVERDAVGAMLALHPAGAEPEDQATSAHVVDRRRHLREHGGMPVRVAAHQHPEPKTMCPGGERAEEGPGFEAALRRSRPGIRHHEVIADEGRVEAEDVGLPPEPEDVVERSALWRGDAEAHPARGRRARRRGRAGTG